MNSPDIDLITGSCAFIGFRNAEPLSPQINQIWTESQYFLDEYRLHLASSGLSQSTIRYYIGDVQQFLEWVEDFPIARSYIGDEIAASFSDYLLQSAHRLRPNSIGKYSPRTIIRKLASIRRFFDHLAEENIIPTNPFREFDAPIPQQTSSAQRDTTLSVETIRELISTCDLSKPLGIRDHTLLMCIVGMGLRVGETHLLDLKDVNLNDKSLKVLERNNKARTVPLLDEIASSLEFWLVVRSLHSKSSDALFISFHHSTGRGEPGRRLSKRAIRKIVTRRLELIGAKQPGVSCEVLRRSGIVHLLKNGAALENIRSTFGLNPRAIRAYKKYVSEI